jgi:chromate transporter
MPRPTLGLIASVFLRYGNWTFGGGSATVGVLQSELVNKRKWVSQETFSLSFALARITPVTNLLAFGTGIGWLLRGVGGTISALLAGSIPCSLVVLIVTALYESWHQNRVVAVGLLGALAAAVGVMIATGWTLIRPLGNYQYVHPAAGLLPITTRSRLQFRERRSGSRRTSARTCSRG